MMNDTSMFGGPPGSTPLEPDDIAGLIPDLKTRGDLNEFEQHNILEAQLWARKSRKLKNDLLSTTGILLLHRHMFDKTWTWAGQFRTRDTNIGVEPLQIQTQVHGLCEDIKAAIANQWFDWPELAIRFHHRLVSVHPFANGNGRHSRLAADLLLYFNKQPLLPWSGHDLMNNNQSRKDYISALQQADRRQYGALIKFVLGERP
jgi:Fic-DOC domain mobile mystery protein B